MHASSNDRVMFETKLDIELTSTGMVMRTSDICRGASLSVCPCLCALLFVHHRQHLTHIRKQTDRQTIGRTNGSENLCACPYVF